MPNWCDNHITITGDKDKIDMIKYLIKETAETKKGVFVSLVGLPPDVTPENYNEKWWDAHIGWWGCKWDIFYDDNGCWTLDEEDCITISVDTAWSPPQPFCEKLASMFDVEVEIEYSEPGCNFAGKAIYTKDGCIYQEDYADYMEGMYHINMDNFWNEVEYRMDYWGEDLEEGEEFDLEKTLADEFSYCSEEHLNEIRKQYNEYYKTNKNEQEA